MQHYFQLRIRLLNRQFKDFGLPPAWGWFLSGVLFTGASWLLFSKTSYAPYLYSLFALAYLLQLSERKRTGFLKITFPRNSYRKIRLLENGIVALPFILFLLVKQNYAAAFTVLVLGLTVSFFDHSIAFNKTIPTPFGKKPFEFLVGFRTYILLISGLYLLTGIAIAVHNFNLGLVTFAAFLLLQVTFCSQPEKLFYLWNDARPPKVFLAEKIKTSALHSICLSVLPLLALLIANPQKWWLLLALQLLACFYNALLIFIKYSTYPHEIDLVQFLTFIACIGFPPLLLGGIPFYYSRSVNNLSRYLS
ncbi:hypothetical protein A8C56_12895 [Niabella ginsenosidivorans]|uniref:Uncharacterized protein n=1 Tax=Niabella ginsenosidivorans TaxID=1176587 RepID=A0A1A9I3X9_9BACT|nr:hypothetical protein [Niabella ginsenosidivorans]ANH81759.1 hypothetical protein A8C56_12895 [Niabella ginsenosidivorans]